MFCKKCGNQLNDGVKFCAKCGTPVATVAPVVEEAPVIEESKLLCKNCGNELKEGVKFCAKCGTSVTVDAAPIEAAAEEIEFEGKAVVAKTIVEDVAEEVSATANEEAVEPETVVEEKIEEEPVVEDIVEEVAPIVEESKPVCKNCGNELKEGVKFCVKCGQPTDVAIDNFAQPVFEQPIVTNGLTSPVAQLKKSLRSCILVVVVVLYFLLAMGRAVASFNTPEIDADNIVPIVATDEDIAEIEEDIEDGLDLISPAAITSSLIASLPILLIATGLIITLVQAYRKDKFATTGFSFVKSAMIIRIIFASLVTLAGVAAMVVVPNIVDEFMRELAKEGLEDASGITDIIPLITTASMSVLIVSQIVSILHSVFALVTVGSMQKTVKKGEASNKKYSGIRIMNYVYVVTNAIGLLFTIAMAIFNNMVIDSVEDMFEAAEGFDIAATEGIVEIMETLLAPNVLNIGLIVLTIAILIVSNIGISKHVKERNETLATAQ